jgi:hypothetical protein
MTESTSACHTLCPSTAIVISSIIKMIVAALIFICALPGDRLRFALAAAAAAILRDRLIVTAEGAPYYCPGLLPLPNRQHLYSLFWSSRFVRLMAAVRGWPVNPRQSGHVRLVSLLVSFSYVLRRSARTTENRQPRSQTFLTCVGLSRADLESVLGEPSSK